MGETFSFYIDFKIDTYKGDSQGLLCPENAELEIYSLD